MESDPQALKAILQGLDSRDEGERNSVAWKLRAASAASDELVVAELIKRLSSEHPPVRRSAARTLREVVPRGPEVVALLLAKIGSPSAEGRVEVLGALEHFASGEQCERCLTALLARLEDSEARVRAAALRALSSLSGRDDAEILTQVLRRLEDADRAVHVALAQALPKLASRGNRQVMDCLAQSCQNQRPPPHRERLKEAACMALAKFAAADEAVVLLEDCLSPEYPDASVAALKALQELPRGHRGALELAARALSQEAHVQEIAMEVLERLADRGAAPPAAPRTAFEGAWSGGVIKGEKIFWQRDDLISDLEVKGKSIIRTTCEDQRGRKLNCWGRLGPGVLRWDFGEEWQRLEVSGDPEPAEPESGQEVGDSYAVAAVAAQFLSKEARCGHGPKHQQGRMGANAWHEECEEPRVRRAAVLAVPRVAGKGCQAAVEVLIPPLEDESVDVRVAAVKSLLLVAEKGDPRAIAALTVRLEDQEVSKDAPQCVGIRAAKALKQLVSSQEELVHIAKNLKFQGPSIRGF